MKYKYHILTTLFLICLIVAILIIIKPVSEICSIKEGCDTVLNSQYSHLLGIKNGYFGIIAFTILTFLTILQIINPSKTKQKIINIGIICGSLIALYFVYLQIFIIQAYCKYCLVIDLALVLSLVTLGISSKWKKEKNN